MPFQSSIVNLAAIANWLDNFGNLGSPAVQLAFGGAINFNNGAGSGDGQINNVSGNTVSVTSGTPVVLDLNTLTNPDGSACTFADLLIIAFYNNSTTGQNLIIGGGSNPVTSIWGSGNLTILGNADGTAGVLIASTAATGYAINSSTAHTFRLESSSGTIQCDFLLAGH